MEGETFNYLREIIYRKSGIVLNDEKQSLLSSRLQKLLRTKGIQQESQYLEIIESDATGYELSQLIDAISTNTTYFWRESEHFILFAEILRKWKEHGRSNLKIWCAASSEGQEPYTLAMEVIQHMQNSSKEVRILATDVNTKVLAHAQHGVYEHKDVVNLPTELRNKFLTQLPDSDDQSEPRWQVNRSVRDLILFKRLNLVDCPYPLKGPIDVIFCRNVMIYFDVKTRQKVIDECSRLLAPGGYLFLSLSESLLGVQHGLAKVSTSVYQKTLK